MKHRCAGSWTVYGVMKAFGLNNREPGQVEKQLISKWTDVFCFENDMIIEACNRTMKATHQPSFEYADSILTKWHTSNIRNSEDVRKADEQFEAFGYELDITKIPEEDRQQIPAQTAMYHKYNDLIRRGDYWRIASYLENGSYDCYMVASKDKKEALVTYVQVLSRPNFHSRRVRLKGLSPENRYRIEETGEVLGGDVLMQAGMLIAPLWGDYRSRLIHLTEA